jgi:NADPH:quinone reductase-like Zn-dependent oxidoreductase
VAHVLALGAERVINVEQESLDAEIFDAVIDAVGLDTPEGLFAALRRGGRLITLQQPPSKEIADKYGVTALFFTLLTWHRKFIAAKWDYTAHRGRIGRPTTHSAASNAGCRQHGSHTHIPATVPGKRIGHV